MAKSIGLSTQAFDKWGIEPIAKVGREAFFLVEDVVDFVVARAERKKGEHNNLLGMSFDEAMEASSLNYMERAELLKVEKIALEITRMRLQNAVLEGRSMPAWAVTEILSKILVTAGEIFDGLALKISRKHPNVDPRVIALVKSEVIRAQNEAAKLGAYSEEIIDDVISDSEAKIN